MGTHPIFESDFDCLTDMGSRGFLVSVILNFVAATVNVIDIGKQNENILEETEVVLVNFYADWCRFSRQLHPIFVNSANLIREAYPDPKRVALGRVYCEDEKELAQKYHISKYPTIKVFRNGKAQKKEYRGNRSPQDFKKFIDTLLKDPVQRFNSLEEAQNIEKRNTKQRHLIGYFESEDSPTYKNFAKVATALQDDCKAIVGFGEASAKERVTGDNSVFKDKPNGNAPISEAVFLGAMDNYDVLFEWAHDKCVPLVREITFSNGEELTEEGLPFLILFHRAEDTESLKKFTEEISRSLIEERGSVNFLHANADQFTHPLHHMGKTPQDCPCITIDSFKHMYLFPDYSKAYKKKYLLNFVKDLHSGKLHREFHHGPDPTTEPEEDEDEEEEEAVEAVDPPQERKVLTDLVKPTAGKRAEVTPAPKVAVEKESIFKKLKPSKHRYSVLDEFPRDEL